MTDDDELLRPSQTDEPDFADEHSSLTHADEVPGGPERTPEPESPSGLAGADPDRT